MEKEVFDNLTALSIRRTQLLGEIVSKLEKEFDGEVPDEMYKEAARKVKGLDNTFFITEEESENEKIDEEKSIEDLEFDLVTLMGNLGLLERDEDDREE